MYNCSCWAAPKHVLETINVMQRKHLRQILGIFWPNKISNEALYKRCNMTPLTDRVNKARWKMLGHVLRSGNCTPAFQAFRFAITGTGDLKGRVGRHRTNLFDVIMKDLKLRGILVRNEIEFNELIDLAYDRSKWKDMYDETN